MRSRLFFSTILSLAMLSLASAQWEAANNGIPGFMNTGTFASHGNILFTGGIEDLGSLILCRSTDSGTTWTTADSGIVPHDSTYFWSPGRISSIVANEARAYAVAWMSTLTNYLQGLFITDDGGISWRVCSPQDNFSGIISLDSSGTLFAGTGNKIFTTTNDGATWDSSIVIPFPQGIVTSLFVHDATMLAQMYSPGENALFRSSNHGLTWDRLTAGLPVSLFSLHAFCLHSGSLFGCGTQRIANTWQTLLLKSTDDGVTWNSPSNDLSIGPASSLVSYQNGLFVGVAASVYMSTNEGVDWTSVGGGGSGPGGINTIWKHGDYLFTGTVYNGVKRRLLSQILPVQLASFTGRYLASNRVHLDWVTVSEINNYGFSVERRSPDQTSFDEIGFAAGHGTTNEPHHYQFIDSTVNSVPIFYRLKQIDLDGATH
ncbi:MAG: sialidase family protein, partial [bacterium]